MAGALVIVLETMGKAGEETALGGETPSLFGAMVGLRSQQSCMGEANRKLCLCIWLEIELEIEI